MNIDTLLVFVILVTLYILTCRINIIWNFLKRDNGRLGEKFREYIK